ncbi:MAG: hypothetical protein AAF289_10915 [Cyanobacteria bacterium P01_A01_bin.135]
MNSATAVLGRFLLAVCAVAGMASYTSARYAQREAELIAALCQGAIACSEGQQLTVTRPIQPWQNEAALTSGALAVGGAGTWVATEALLAQRRRRQRLERDLTVMQRNLKTAQKDLRRSQQVQQALQPLTRPSPQRPAKELGPIQPPQNGQVTQPPTLPEFDWRDRQAELERQNRHLGQQQQQAAAEKIQREAELDAAYQRIAGADATIGQLRNRLEAAKRDRNAVLARLQWLEQQNQDMQADSAQVDQLEQELIAEKSTAEALRLKVSNAKKIEAQAVEENSALQRQICDLENQLAIATSMLPQPQSTASTAELLTLVATEVDFYVDEKRDMVLELLQAALPSVEEDTRRYHVLQDILAQNTVTGEGHAIAERLSVLLRDYKRMDHKVKRGFADLGFEIVEDGKHYKAVFKNDERYTRSFPKTGSDRRGGRNLISEIRRRCL